MKCPLLHGNIQKETDRGTEISFFYDFMRFGDSSIQPPEASSKWPSLEPI